MLKLDRTAILAPSARLALAALPTTKLDRVQEGPPWPHEADAASSSASNS